MALDWSILRSTGPIDFAGNFARGYKIADDVISTVQQKRALGALAQDPDDRNALAQLYRVNPEMGDHFERRAVEREQTIREAQVRAHRAELGQLYNRDAGAAQEEAIASGEFDLAKTFAEIGDPERKRAADVWSAIGPIAYRMKGMPPEQRQQFWGEARPMLEAKGADSAVLDQFDPMNDVQIDAALTQAQKISDLIEQGKITWHQQGEQPSFATDSMGRPVGSQNPYARGGAGAAPAPSGGTRSAPRGVRNNNPLNLTRSGFTEGQPGYAGTDQGGRYARFETPEAGMQAGGSLLESYLRRGFDTPAKIIGRWAPASENGASTANYTNYVSRKLGIAPNQRVAPEQIGQLAQAMAEFENGGHGGGRTGSARQIHSKAEYDSLSSGDAYIAPDGSRRIKP